MLLKRLARLVVALLPAVSLLSLPPGTDAAPRSMKASTSLPMSAQGADRIRAGLKTSVREAVRAHRQGDEFGITVAISGSVAVAGGDNSTGAPAGPVYVFARSGRAWHRQAILSDPAGKHLINPDNFGSAVAVSNTRRGPIVFIGVPGGGTNGTGLVYVYVRSGTTWHRQARLTSPASSCACGFGVSLAASGATAVIGLASVLTNGKNVAYVFARSGVTWHREATLTDPASGGDLFGAITGGVSISGGIAVIGAPEARRNHGTVDVFDHSGRRWRLVQVLTDPAVHQIEFGWSVGISGRALIVSAPGTAYVFARPRVTWRLQARLAKHRGLQGVISVAIDGSRAIVGDPNAGTRLCGRAFEYIRSAKNWPERAVVVNPGCSSGDLFGWSIGIVGKTAVFGAPGKNRMTGAIYVAELR